MGRIKRVFAGLTENCADPLHPPKLWSINRFFQISENPPDPPHLWSMQH